MGEWQHLILYTSSACSRCKLIRQMLDDSEVAYTEIADNQQLMEAKDLYSVPALEVDNKIIDEYSSVLCWLQHNGYYSLGLWGENTDD